MNETNTSDIISKMHQKLLKDLEVNELFEAEYLLQLSIKISNWQYLLSKKAKEYHQHSTLKDEKYKELYMYYQFEFDIKLDKKELGIFINADSEMRKIMFSLSDLEIQIKFIEGAIKDLESQQWALKNRLEYLTMFGNKQ